MTNEYKKNLLKYLTNNLEQETGTEAPSLIDKGLQDKNVYNYLTNNLDGTPEHPESLQIENLDYVLFYGNYYSNDDSTMYYGYICITDKNLTPVALFTEYSSGTQFRPFVAMNVDEDGNFYGVDNKNKLYDSTVANDYRFIMLNKIINTGIASGQFVVSLRQSYYFDSTINSQIYNFGRKKNRCTKKIDASEYFFFPLITSSNKHYLGVVSLKIVVGASNEWDLKYNTSLGGSIEIDTYNIYSEENFEILITTDKYGYSDDCVEALYVYADTPTLTVQNTFEAPEGFGLYSFIRLALQTLYVAYYEGTDGTNDTIGIYKCDYDNLSFTNIYKFELPSLYLGSSIYLFNINNMVFFKAFWYEEGSGSYTYMINSYIGLICNDLVYYIAGYQSPFVGNISIFKNIYINKIYNIFTIYNPIYGTQTQKILLIYNSNNYNGNSYTNINSLFPFSSVLYNSDSNPIFARNLYNKVVSGRETVSTIQIPNTLLNDEQISQEILLSETNSEINNESLIISKNIYETVNINFDNMLQIINENTNERILNSTGAERINDSVSQTLDYDNAKITKARINYADNTSLVVSISFRLIQDGARTEFNIYAEKEIYNIELISNDEATVYNTITGNFTVGNYYKISQDVTVEDLTLNVYQLLYNNEEILYNNEEIYVVGG